MGFQSSWRTYQSLIFVTVLLLQSPTVQLRRKTFLKRIGKLPVLYVQCAWLFALKLNGNHWFLGRSKCHMKCTGLQNVTCNKYHQQIEVVLFFILEARSPSFFSTMSKVSTLCLLHLVCQTTKCELWHQRCFNFLGHTKFNLSHLWPTRPTCGPELPVNGGGMFQVECLLPEHVHHWKVE